MPEPEATPETTPADSSVPTAPPVDPANADLQAKLDAANQRADDAEAKRDEFGADNQKLRGQRKKWKTAKAGDEDTKGADAVPQDSGESDALRKLAISSRAEAELIKQGADPKLVDLAVAGLDMDQIEIVDGRIEGVAEAVTALLKDRPELKLAKPTSPGVIDGAPGGSKTEVSDPLTYTREQLAAMPDAEWDAFTAANPEVTMQIGDGPPITCNISSIPNAAFGRVQAAQKRHAEVTARLTGGG